MEQYEGGVGRGDWWHFDHSVSSLLVLWYMTMWMTVCVCRQLHSHTLRSRWSKENVNHDKWWEKNDALFQPVTSTLLFLCLQFSSLSIELSTILFYDSVKNEKKTYNLFIYFVRKWYTWYIYVHYPDIFWVGWLHIYSCRSNLEYVTNCFCCAFLSYFQL